MRLAAGPAIVYKNSALFFINPNKIKHVPIKKQYQKLELTFFFKKRNTPRSSDGFKGLIGLADI